MRLWDFARGESICIALHHQQALVITYTQAWSPHSPSFASNPACDIKNSTEKFVKLKFSLKKCLQFFIGKKGLVLSLWYLEFGSTPLWDQVPSSTTFSRLPLQWPGPWGDGCHYLAQYFAETQTQWGLSRMNEWRKLLSLRRFSIHTYCVEILTCNKTRFSCDKINIRSN